MHHTHIDAARWSAAQQRVHLQRAGEARAALERLDAARRARISACLTVLGLALVAAAAVIWSVS